MVQVSLLFVLEAQRVKTSKHPSPPPPKKEKRFLFCRFPNLIRRFFRLPAFHPIFKAPLSPPSIFRGLSGRWASSHLHYSSTVLYPDQCFQIFGFQIFGFGFPNNTKTSDFEYRIRSFIRQEKTTKRGNFGKKIFDGQKKFWNFTIILFKKRKLDYFSTRQAEKHNKSESESSV